MRTRDGARGKGWGSESYAVRALLDDPLAQARQQWIEHGWGAAANGMEAAVSLIRAHQLLVGRIDAALKPFDLTFARYEVLMLLKFTSEGALQVTRMGRLLQVHQTSVSSTVSHLETSGFVVRQPHPGDHRGTLVSITDSGHAAADMATPVLNLKVFASLDLDASQVNILWRCLRSLRKNAGDF